MEPSNSVESTESGASAPPVEAITSTTSSTPKSKTTRSESPNITPADRLKMVQTILADKIPGVKLQRASVYHGGESVAAVLIIGCAWDASGNLVLKDA